VATIEVFADVRCPFTHVGLRRLVERRAALGRTDIGLRVRAWPLELVNDAPLNPALIAEEVAALRAQAGPDLFAGFDATRFPASSLPALALAAAAYDRGTVPGERVSLALRNALFEDGHDVADPGVLREVAVAAGIESPIAAPRQVLADWEEGRRRGVVGSPHFFVRHEGYFCPSLDISRVHGRLRVTSNPAIFDAFLARSLGE
jgi:predicted DsbA family dithiol-disulfide isomerase